MANQGKYGDWIAVAPNHPVVPAAGLNSYDFFSEACLGFRVCLLQRSSTIGSHDLPWKACMFVA